MHTLFAITHVRETAEEEAGEDENKPMHRDTASMRKPTGQQLSDGDLFSCRSAGGGWNAPENRSQDCRHSEICNGARRNREKAAARSRRALADKISKPASHYDLALRAARNNTIGTKLIIPLFPPPIPALPLSLPLFLSFFLSFFPASFNVYEPNEMDFRAYLSSLDGIQIEARRVNVN